MDVAIPTAGVVLLPRLAARAAPQGRVCTDHGDCDCYLLAVSTRRMEKLVENLGIIRLSKSQVSLMAQELDADVEGLPHSTPDAGPYAFVAADALTTKVREGVGWSTPTSWSPRASTPTGTARC